MLSPESARQLAAVGQRLPVLIVVVVTFVASPVARTVGTPGHVVFGTWDGREIAWYQDRMFNVPRLNFSSRLRVSLSAQNQSEQLVALPDRDLASWENRLDYRIGRIESSMVLRVSRIDDRQQVFAMWRLQRTFGG